MEISCVYIPFSRGIITLLRDHPPRRLFSSITEHRTGQSVAPSGVLIICDFLVLLICFSLRFDVRSSRGGLGVTGRGYGTVYRRAYTAAGISLTISLLLSYSGFLGLFLLGLFGFMLCDTFVLDPGLGDDDDDDGW